MQVQNLGVLSASQVYFHTHSETARKLYFYPLCTGHYYCNEDYCVSRTSYNSFLLLFVVEGSGFVCVNGKETSLAAGSFFWLDCYAPHSYGTHTGWEIFWVHYDGVLARAYFEAATEDENCAVLVPADPYGIQRNFESIYRMYHETGKASEPALNKYIVYLLTPFLSKEPHDTAQGGAISDELLTYITENLHLPLSLADLAKRAAFSPYYFTRRFKKETGHTPHEYLVLARVNAAKFYLKSTSLPSKDIAFRCGFAGEASFCTTFKRLTGKSPLAYRRSEL